MSDARRASAQSARPSRAHYQAIAGHQERNDWLTNARRDGLRARDQMQRILRETGTAHKRRDPLRARADRVSQEFELEGALSDKPRGRGR